MTGSLPSDIDKILEYLAGMAARYSTGLKWNEVAKLKADLMANRRYWQHVPVPAIRARLLELGMSEDDADTVCELVGKAQAGRRLVPEASYRNATFRHDDAPPSLRPATTTDW